MTETRVFDQLRQEHTQAGEIIARVQGHLHDAFDMDAMATALRTMHAGDTFDMSSFERSRRYDGFPETFSPHLYQRGYDDMQGGLRPSPLEVVRFDTLPYSPLVYDKREDLQPRVGAFKIHGALFAALAKLQVNPKWRTLTTGSAGNHAQGVVEARDVLNRALLDAGLVPHIDNEALEAQGGNELFAAHTHCPEKAALPKLQNLRARRAKVVLDGYEVVHDATNGARHEAEVGGDAYTYIDPYDDTTVMAGQSTVVLETLFQLKQQGVDLCARPVVVRLGVGGGGLYTGAVTALEWAIAEGLVHPGSRAVPGEPEGCDAGNRAFMGQEPLSAATIDTTADGLATLEVSQDALAVLRKYNPEGMSVVSREHSIRAAAALTLAHRNAMPEMAAVIGVGQLMQEADSRHFDYRHTTQVAITSGGNVSAELAYRLSTEFKHHDDVRVSKAAQVIGAASFALLSRAHLYAPAEITNRRSPLSERGIVRGPVIRVTEDMHRRRRGGSVHHSTTREQLEAQGIHLVW